MQDTISCPGDNRIIHQDICRIRQVRGYRKCPSCTYFDRFRENGQPTPVEIDLSEVPQSTMSNHRFSLSYSALIIPPDDKTFGEVFRAWAGKLYDFF